MKRYSPILLLTLCIAIGSPPAAVRGELSSHQTTHSALALQSLNSRLIAQAEAADTPAEDSEKPSEKPSEKGKSSDKKSSQTPSSKEKTNPEKSIGSQWKKTLWWVGLGTTGVAAIAFLYFLFRLSRPQSAVQAIGPEFSPALPEDEPELELDSPSIPVSQEMRSLPPANKDVDSIESKLTESQPTESKLTESPSKEPQPTESKLTESKPSRAAESVSQSPISDRKTPQKTPQNTSQKTPQETPKQAPKETPIEPSPVAEVAQSEKLKPEPSPAESKPVPIEETVPMRRINIVDALIQDLHSPDPNKRRKAIWELGQRGDSRAIQPLVDLMLDSDSSQRSLILGVLAEIGTRTVKPMNRALAVSLQDDSPEVRKNAIRDLTRIYDSIAQMSQLLNHAIDDADGEVSETARWALGQLNRIRSLPRREEK